MIKKFHIISLVTLIFLSCKEPDTSIERSGKVYNYFTNEGEAGVEVCTETPQSCAITDKNGVYTLVYEGDEYLFSDEYFSIVNSYAKTNVTFRRFNYDYDVKWFAIPRTWIRINITPDPPFQHFGLITSDGNPFLQGLSVVPGMPYSEVFEIIYSANQADHDKRWWEKFLVAIDYFNSNGDLVRSPIDTINLQSLDTVDVFFNF